MKGKGSYLRGVEVDEDWKRVDVEEQKHLERKSNIGRKVSI